MKTSPVEPNALLNRLERKFERKVRVIEQYRRSNRVRQTLARFQGMQAQNAARHDYDLDYELV